MESLFEETPEQLDASPLFEANNEVPSSVIRYNAALRSALSGALAASSGVPHDGAESFTSNTEKLQYASPAEYQFVTRMEARMAAYAEAEKAARQVLASPEASVLGMEKAETTIPLVVEDKSEEEVAYTLQTGNAIVAEAVSRNVAYGKDYMEALEATGWDFSKTGLAGLAQNLLDLRTLAEALPFRMVWDWQKYMSPKAMAEYQRMSVSQQNEYRREVMASLKAADAYPLTVLHVMSMLDPTKEPGEMGEEIGWGLVDIVGSIFQIPAMIKTAGKVKKAYIVREVDKIIEAQRLARGTGAAAALGDTDTAASIAARTLLETDGRVGKAANLSKLDAAIEMSPFDFRPLSPEQTRGLSAKTIKAIERERKIQYWYILKALGKEVSETSGPLRPAEQLAALERIKAGLPENAEVIKSTPIGAHVRVTIRNEGKFVTEEDLLKAQRDYDVAIENYTAASDRLDEFWKDAAGGKWEPDPTWVNKLEGDKRAAQLEMDRLEKVLIKGIEPDAVTERFVFFTKAEDTGGLSGDVKAFPLTELALSPEVWMRPIDNLLVRERTVALAKQEQLHKLYKEAMFDVLANIGRKGASKVDRILLHGDDTKTVFTPAELKQGIDVPGVGTVKLGDKEIAAYLKYRDLLDQAYTLRNLMKFRELGWKGFRQVVINNLGNKQKVFVQDFKGIPSVSRIWDNTTRDPSKIVQVTPAYAEKLKKDIDAGKKVVVKLEERLKSGDEEFTYMVVRRNQINDLTPDVLPYTGPWYVPRISKDSPYVVRAHKDIYVDGSKEKAWQTVRFFDRKEEASAWAADQTRESGINHVADSDWNWKEVDTGYASASDEAVFTGLFNDHRGELIPFGVAGGPAPREDAMTSLERYLTNLSWAYPLNDFREGAITRFVNTIGDKLQNPNAWMDTELQFKAGVSVAEQNGVKQMRNWLMDTIGITTEGERRFARSMKQAAEYLEQYSDNGVFDYLRMKMIYGADRANLAGWFRTLNFRMHLAMGNPSQLVVQAGNVAQILGANPQNAHRVIPRLLGMRMMAFMSPDSPAWKSAVKYYSKAALMRASEFEDMMKVAWKSGYFFTVRTNADAAMAIRGMAPGGDVRHAARFLDTALQVPFLEGELWGRMVGLADAYTRLRKANGGVDLAGDINKVDEVIGEALRVGYNYTQVNRAYFQKQGALSIITQFIQPMTKFYEEVVLPTITFGKVESRFTKAELMRLWLTQPILFGLAGVPFGEYMKELVYSIYESLTGKQRGEISKEEIVSIEGGITDLTGRLVVSALTDKDMSPVIAERVALANLNQFFAKFAPETTMYEFMLGAGAVLPRRLKLGWEMWHAMHSTSIEAGSFGINDMAAAMFQLSTLATSMTNVQKARIWRQANAVMNSTFTKSLYELDPEDSKGITLARAWGFSTYEEKAVWEMREYLEKHNPEKEVKDTIEAVARLTLNYLEDGNLTTDPEKLKLYKLQKAILFDSLPSATLRNKAREAWSEKIVSRNYYVTEAAQKYIDMQLETQELEQERPTSFNIVTEEK